MYEQHVFLDFEMNPIPKDHPDEREIAKAEIIQIGAVRLDETYTLTDRFSMYVKPAYGEISPHITHLTGIKDSDVKDAPCLADALIRFAGWIGDKCTRLYSWSLTDLWQLEDECWLKEIEMPAPLLSRWMDFQMVYTRLMGLSQRNPMSLKNAIGAVEGCLEGRQHSAVSDAENSAALLTLVKSGDFMERTRSVRAVLSGKTRQTGTLGDAAATLGGLLGEI